MRAMEKNSYARINYFQDNIAQGRENDWRCRAGSRYLYICEDGLVHYCSQQRGYPAKPLMEYTRRRYPPRIPHRQESALRAARWPACTRSPTSISGAANRTWRPWQP